VFSKLNEGGIPKCNVKGSVCVQASLHA